MKRFIRWMTKLQIQNNVLPLIKINVNSALFSFSLKTLCHLVMMKIMMKIQKMQVMEMVNP